MFCRLIAGSWCHKVLQPGSALVLLVALLGLGCASPSPGADASGLDDEPLRVSLVPLPLTFPRGTVLRDIAADPAGGLILVGDGEGTAVAARYDGGTWVRERQLPALGGQPELVAVASAGEGRAVAVGALREQGAAELPLILLREEDRWIQLPNAQLPAGSHRLVDVACRTTSKFDCDVLVEGLREVGQGNSLSIWHLRDREIVVGVRFQPAAGQSGYAPRGLLMRGVADGWDLLAFGALDNGTVAIAREAGLYRRLPGSLPGAELLAAVVQDGGALLVGRTRTTAVQGPSPPEPVVRHWLGDTVGLRRDQVPQVAPGEWLEGVATLDGELVAVSIADQSLQPMTSALWRRRGASWARLWLPPIASPWRIHAIVAADAALFAVGERREGAGPDTTTTPLLLRVSPLQGSVTPTRSGD